CARRGVRRRTCCGPWPWPTPWRCCPTGTASTKATPSQFSGCCRSLSVVAAVPLIDPFDRQVRDLRVSVTDRCNFRCSYCMPEEGFGPVKVNCVLVRGVNDDEIVDFARFGRERGVVVRFIEFMPLDAQGEWRSDAVVSYDEVLSTIDAVYPLEPVDVRGSQPA